MTRRDLTGLKSHFHFGENWRSYVDLVDDDRIRQAETCLRKLVDPHVIAGSSFLDIGCGSGIHLLAAMRLGAGFAYGIDLDPTSVEAAQTLFARVAPDAPVRLENKSVFELRPERDGLFDIVYSWGVLHHTGAMWQAITSAMASVKPGGLLVLALYKKTRLCKLWRLEKRIYARSPKAVQRAIQVAYVSATRRYLGQDGVGFDNHVRTYGVERGMDFWHDVHDWLGGYPYESTTKEDLLSFASQKGFRVVRTLEAKVGNLGLFGSGCTEFTLVKL